MEDIVNLLRTDMDSLAETSLGSLVGPGRLYHIIPEDVPAVTYSFAFDGNRSLLTVIVYGGDPQKIHTRVRKLLTESQSPGRTIKYITAGPRGWDRERSCFTQRATYLIKIAPKTS